MRPFTGFANTKGETILPDEFFDQLLPAMDDFAELKVFLHVIRRLEHQVGWPRTISRTELLHDEQLIASLTAVGDVRPLADVLDHALERASQRGCLLRLTVRDGEQSEQWFLLNTERGRAVVRDLQMPGSQTSALRQRLALSESATLDTAKPNIFTLYEQNIGLLSRLLAEELMDAEATYPEAWIEDAFRKAVESNKRSWRYIKAILGRWAAEGREDGTVKRHPGEVYDPDHYLKGEFGHFFRH
jgi:DnaD/phage-associated family protein